MPIIQAPIYLSFEEVTMHAGDKVQMKVDDNIGNQKEILKKMINDYNNVILTSKNCIKMYII